VIDCTRRLAPFVVLDVPCTFDALFFRILAAAEPIVLVAEQKLLALRTLKLLREALARSAPYRRHHVVINRYESRKAGFTLSDLERLLEVPDLLGIRNDEAAVSAAMHRGRLLRLETPHSPVLADTGVLARALVGDQEQARKSSGLFRQLRRAVGLQ
jgi:Flp pilus assembly CpaE family ATPase